MDLSKTVSNIPYVNELLRQILLLTKFVSDYSEPTKKWLLETDFRTFSVDDVYNQYIDRISDITDKTRCEVEHYIDQACIGGCQSNHHMMGHRYIKSILSDDGNSDDFWHIYYMDSKESTYRYIPNVSCKFIKQECWYQYKYYDFVITNLKMSLNIIRNYNEVVSEFKEFHPRSIYLHQLVESWSAEV
jgi:hypothetical protein